MSVVEYIEAFVKYFTMFIDLIKGFFESLTGKTPAEPAPEVTDPANPLPL